MSLGGTVTLALLGSTPAQLTSLYSCIIDYIFILPYMYIYTRVYVYLDERVLITRDDAMCGIILLSNFLNSRKNSKVCKFDSNSICSI